MQKVEEKKQHIPKNTKKYQQMLFDNHRHVFISKYINKSQRNHNESTLPHISFIKQQKRKKK